MKQHFTEAEIAPFLPYPYTDLARFDDESGPVRLSFQINETQFLRLHGTEHTNNPDAPQYEDFRQSWQAFLEETANNPSKRLATVEGKIHDAAKFRDYDDPEREAIRRIGVNALTCLWAESAGVRVKRPEPPNYAEIDALLNQFTKDEIVATYAIRQASQLPDLWQGGSQTPHETYIANFLASELSTALIERFPAFAGYDFSYDHFVAVHKRMLSTEPTHEAVLGYRDLLKSFITIPPNQSSCAAVEVSRESFHQRVIYRVGEYATDLAIGWSIFGDQGWFHVRASEGALSLIATRLASHQSAFPISPARQ